LPHVQQLGLHKRLVAVKDCRKIGKANMIHNSATPQIEVEVSGCMLGFAYRP
jgi:urease subunit alpha